MNAHTTIQVEPESPQSKETSKESGRAAPTPADLAITVRDLRFGRGTPLARRWWLNDDPVATAWHNALSATFPRGEAFFVETVKSFRDGTPPALNAAIRAFIAQEINHTREHVSFNKAATDAGYDLRRIDAHVEEMMAMTKGRPEIVNLAATMALEHYTAMMAHEILADPRHFAGADGETARMWHWHATEEVEHKGVAYDTWLHATRHWPRSKRWRLKAVMMLVVSKNFISHRVIDTLDLLAQDGLTGWKIKAQVAWYLLGNPGILRRIFPAWLAYFMPGFHPWNHDNRALIAKADARLPVVQG
ncbi:MAG: metal-dependent hydrolase [Novosphingobium sp.]